MHGLFIIIRKKVDNALIVCYNRYIVNHQNRSDGDEIMRIKLLGKNSRCPCCGNISYNFPHRYGPPKCAECGTHYVRTQQGKWFVLYLIWVLLYMNIISYLCKMFSGYLSENPISDVRMHMLAILLLMFMCLLGALTIPENFFYTPTEIYDINEIFPEENRITDEFKAEINIADEFGKYFVSGYIYPICFHNEDMTSVSEYVCVRIIKNDDHFAVKTLPLGRNIGESCLDCGFIIFFGGKNIGTGKISS